VRICGASLSVLEKKTGFTPLVTGCMKGSYKSLEFVLNRNLIKFDVSLMFDIHLNEEGNSFLHHAAKLNNYKLVF
jgi:hypothetical protein